MESALRIAVQTVLPSLPLWLLLGTALWVWLAARRRRAAGGGPVVLSVSLLGAAALLVLVLSLPAGQKLAMHLLVPDDLPPVRLGEAAGAQVLPAPRDGLFIAVFSGGVRRHPDGGWQPNWNTSRRVLRALAAAEHHDLPLAVSGGRVPPQAPPEAEIIREQFALPPDTPLDMAARDTRENAAGFAAIAGRRGWHRAVVATDALHLRRAAAALRAAGIAPVAALVPNPVGAIGPRDFLPSPGVFNGWRAVGYEVAAIAYYLLDGRIRAADL